MNVIIWARVSSREQREGYSIDAQLRACRAKAEKSGWTVVREIEVAESAKRGAERQAFNEMYRWVKKNARKLSIQGVLAHKLDRVCRNMRDAVRMQELEDDCGVQLVFVENDFGPGAAGALSFNVMAAVAQYYSDNLRTEVRKGMDERARQGWPVGRAPFGYLNVAHKACPVIPHPEKKDALVRIFQLFAAGEYTFATLAERMLAEGYVYQLSQPRFSRMGLSQILNNRFYIGELIVNGVLHRGAYEVVVDRVLFDTCQNLLNGRNRQNGLLNPDLVYTAGLFRCAHCDHGITGERIRRKLRDGGVREHHYYRCANNNADPGHPKVRWREADIEGAIHDTFHAIRLPNDQVRQWLRGSLEQMLSDTTRCQAELRSKLVRRRNDLATRQERLMNLYLAGQIDDELHRTKRSEFEQEREQAEKELAELKFDTPTPVEGILKAFDNSQNLAERWQGSTTAEKRALLESVSLNRQIDDVTIDIPKRNPFSMLAEMAVGKNGRGSRI